MKNSIHIVFIFMMLSSIVFAQVDKVLSLSSLQIDLYDNVNKSKGVYIQQIGNSNHLNTNTQSLNSSINLFQYGNDNEINLRLNAISINETVIQKGNKHVFLDVSLKKTLLHSANVLQIGKNQRLYWQGANSISKKMLITMKGNNQTILIRNIK